MTLCWTQTARLGIEGLNCLFVICLTPLDSKERVYARTPNCYVCMYTVQSEKAEASSQPSRLYLWGHRHLSLSAEQLVFVEPASILLTLCSAALIVVASRMESCSYPKRPHHFRVSFFLPIYLLFFGFFFLKHPKA